MAYLHPYDIDTEQERFMHPEINESRFYNWLLYRNRGRVFERLEKLLQCGPKVVPYAEYVAETLERQIASQQETHLPLLPSRYHQIQEGQNGDAEEAAADGDVARAPGSRVERQPAAQHEHRNGHRVGAHSRDNAQQP